MGLSIPCIILFFLISSLTCAPTHLISKRQVGYGSPGAPVVSSYSSYGQAAPSFAQSAPSSYGQASPSFAQSAPSSYGQASQSFAQTAPAAAPAFNTYAASAAGQMNSPLFSNPGAGLYSAGYGTGLSLGLASYGNVGAGLGIGGLGIGGYPMGGAAVERFGPAIGSTIGLGPLAPGVINGGGIGPAGPVEGYGMGMGGMGMGGMGMGGIGMGMGGMGMGMGMPGVAGMGVGMPGVAAMEGIGMGGVPGAIEGPTNFGVGSLEIVGPYSIGGVYGPYGWNGLGGRAAQWGLAFGPWDYPQLRLERFEDLLAMNKQLSMNTNNNNNNGGYGNSGYGNSGYANTGR